MYDECDSFIKTGKITVNMTYIIIENKYVIEQRQHEIA